MSFWGSLIGYQVTWFAIVIGAGREQPWPGIVTALGFVIWQSWGAQRALMLRLVAVALLAGLVIDGALVRNGMLVYASPWPSPQWPPLWILAIWAAFAVTLPRSLAFLQGRPWLAAALGAVGGPLAYLAAAQVGSAVEFAMPQWPALVVLASAWAVAMPLLATYAMRSARAASLPALASGVPSQ